MLSESLIATIRRSPLFGPEEQVEENEFLVLYGEWKPLAPTQVADELAGFTRPCWVIGGRAIEGATGYRREHEDTDISILSTHVAAFIDHLRGRWHVWNNVGGVLHPLGDRWTTVDEPRSQLWLRANASARWAHREKTAEGSAPTSPPAYSCIQGLRR